MLATATLTEKGLVDTGDVFVVAAMLSVAAGLLVGRWRALVAGPAVVALAVAGIAAGWWGAGLGDGWEASFVRLVIAAVALTGTGVVLHRAARAVAVRRGSVLGRAWRASIASLALVTVAAFLFVSTRPPDVEDVQAQAASTLYYLGDSFAGYRLTHAEGGGGRALFAYGDCEQPLGYVDGGCSVPIQLQLEYAPGTGRSGCGPPPGRARPKPEDPAALLVFAGSTMIEIYAHDRALGQRAARELRPVAGSCP